MDKRDNKCSETNVTGANIDITHSFSRAQAQQYGVHGAILLGYLINRIKNSTNIKDGKRWFYDSVAGLKENYPYLSETAVNNARRTLIRDKGPLVTGNDNKWRKDRTTWYAVRDDRTLKSPEDDLLYFKVWEANAYGVLEAILMNNLRYWLEEKKKENPEYKYHPASPRKLEEVFLRAFSRNSIARALKHLVTEGILIPKAPEHANDPIAYRFAGPEDEAEGGPTENKVAQARTATGGGPSENRVAQNEGRGPSENTPGPTERIPGPSENEGGPTENKVAHPRTKVAQPRTTIPINNYLKGDSLKDCLEVCLKEDRFKASSVGVSSNTPQDAASKHETAGSFQTAHHSFDEPIAGSLPPASSAQLTRKDPASNPFVESIAGSLSAFPVSASDPTPPPLHNPLPAVAEVVKVAPSNRFENEPYYKFLDLNGIHKECWEVMEFHDKNADPTYQDMAETIVGVAERLIDETEPAQLYRLCHINNQRTLNAELFIWSGKYFEEVFDRHLSMPECPENAELREVFRAHSLCFLNMAFHCLKFDAFRIYCGKPYAQIQQALWNRLSPWIEEQQSSKRCKTIQERSVQFASPDADKEADPELSAAEKMQVLRQSLQARNRIGRYDEFGQFTEQVVEVTQHTPILARQFFQLNPHFTVQHINQVIDACLKLPNCYGEEEQDPQWHARNGYKISLLLNNLTQVATQLNMLSQLPAFTPLPIDEAEQEH